MEAGNDAILLDAQIELAAFGIRQADHGCNQVPIWQTVTVALELDGDGLAVRDGAIHV